MKSDTDNGTPSVGETPRTDAHDTCHDGCVGAAFARQLERELAAKSEALETERTRARYNAETREKQLATVTKERDEALKDSERLTWLLDFITQNGANGIAAMQWSVVDPEEIMEDRMEVVFDRATIDAARKETE